MSGFGDFYNKKKKKLSREEMAKRAAKSMPSWVVPAPQLISKGKKDRRA